MCSENPSIVVPPRQPRQPTCAREFAMSFTATDRGARLARRLVTRRLDAWGYPRGTEASDAVTLIAAELTANAVRHGHVPGREFRLVLGLCGPDPVTVRVEVSDARGDRLPPEQAPVPRPDAESGRGLWLVASLAARWAVVPRTDAPGKTVWAEVDV
ncbi:ATP-binding protein [Streptantibioticus parmotrematis]|uniref:ATP-binding protein n=1 Tax=Streptantibioticus parmotrematis TaxID=2873249 RepID=UPI0033F6E696